MMPLDDRDPDIFDRIERMPPALLFGAAYFLCFAGMVLLGLACLWFLDLLGAFS